MMNASNHPKAKEPDFNGCRILVVEDEYYIAADVCNALEVRGAEIVGPVPTLSKALPLAEREKLHCAVLDLNLRGESSLEVARMLAQRNVPIIYSTGYPISSVPEYLAGAAHLEKPFRIEDLVGTVDTVIHRRDHGPLP